jgi:hypothetical protein
MTALGAQFKDFHNFDNPTQLSMFMTGKELKGNITESGDVLPGQMLGDMWKSKLETAKKPLSSDIPGSGSYDSIKNEGWNPADGSVVQAKHGFGSMGGSNVVDFGVADAHHRIAAAADIEDQTGKKVFFPVEHTLGGRHFYQSEADSANSLG